MNREQLNEQFGIIEAAQIAVNNRQCARDLDGVWWVLIREVEFGVWDGVRIHD